MASIDLPFVAIGGIKEHNIGEVAAHGANAAPWFPELVGAPDIAEKGAQAKEGHALLTFPLMSFSAIRAATGRSHIWAESPVSSHYCCRSRNCAWKIDLDLSGRVAPLPEISDWMALSAPFFRNVFCLSGPGADLKNVTHDGAF